MCGIYGQFNFNNDKPIDKKIIREKTNSIQHRGPDDEGYYYTDSLALGFRRLSIIDLEGGHQPMSSVDGKIWVIFNGEIYNFPELKKELESYGHVFQTISDTEVIIYGYIQWGVEVFNHLNGMFGLAIWDEKNKKLIISRDRMGIKLVYYRIRDGIITFGSELRTLYLYEDQKPEIDTESLNLFLRYRYTPSPRTIFKDISKLAPGSCIIVENGKCKTLRWWKYKPSIQVPAPKVKDLKHDLLELYRKSMKRHLLSDVPLGLLLSGGIDSAMLLGLMNEFGNSWETFTVGYGKDFADDELGDAFQTAQILKAPNNQVKIDKKIFEDNFSNVISCLEELIASASIIPMYFLCRLAREKVKVALIGQGPDELFGGYKRHLGLRYGKYWRDVPALFRDPLKKMLNKVPRAESIKRGIYSLDVPDRMERYQQVFSINSREVVDGLFKEGSINNKTGDLVFDCWDDIMGLIDETDELGGFQFFEIRSSLPDELLMYADKLSMAHSLELRVPYLDKEIVEYVETLPASMKIQFGNQKWIHREICKNYLPKEIINRKKRAFAVNVVDEWFQSSMNSKFVDYLNDPTSMIFEFLNYNSIQKLLQDHQTRKEDNYKIIFSIVLFEEWLRSFYQ